MAELNNFISITPKFSLNKHIDSYYFHSCKNKKSILKYTYYPHIKHAITIYKDSTAETSGNFTLVKPKKAAFTVLYSTVRDQPQNVEIRGNFKKIGIVFKPHGINHFVDRPLKEFNKNTISYFKEWDSGLKKIIEKIWETQDINQKILLLESFLKKQETLNFNQQFDTIIGDISKLEKIESVQKLSKHFNLSRKTFYRIFVKELNCSPSKFLKILRFRNSLENYLSKSEINLTAAAVTQFYDQSDFIKNVKQITAITPKKFTQEISDLKNSIFWKIE